MTKKGRLKGSYREKGEGEYINYDIIESRLELPNDKKILQINSLTIYDGKKSDTYYIYHSFDTKEKSYGGRWYDVSLKPDKDFEFNDKEKEVKYIIPEWEEDNYPGNIDIIKNVPIYIKFTDKGYKKFKKLLN